jgi:hypothetical protein
MPFGEHDHPFYRPLWRRLAIVAVTAAWAGFELSLGASGLWSLLACGVFAYSLWTFLINWKDKPPPQP